MMLGNRPSTCLFASLISIATMTSIMPAAEKQIVIAHRGASGYLPEHTLPAKALAYAMGADYIEQDVVLTRDGHPIVLHDIHLDTVTDVAKKFRDRARGDGRFYAIDFDLDEIKQLAAHERTDHDSEKAVFPKRFPVGQATFEIPTLDEEIELIQGLNQSTGRHVGIYPEIKQPAFHRAAGQDISRIVLKTLAKYGYDAADDLCYLQCFDATETRRIREQLKSQLPLVQLATPDDWNKLTSGDNANAKSALDKIAEYANGFGPDMSLLIEVKDGKAIANGIAKVAQQCGLVVHPYTFRRDQLPTYVEGFDGLHHLFFDQVGIDGVFTDFPDLTARWLRK